MIHSFKAEQTDANLNFDIELERDKRVYCFFGENGVGKTNLVENMARALLHSHNFFRSTSTTGRFPNKLARSDFQAFFGHWELYFPEQVTLNGLVTKRRKEDSWRIANFAFISANPPACVFDEPLVFVGGRNRGYTQNISPGRLRLLGSTGSRFCEAFAGTYVGCSGIAKPAGEVLSPADWICSRLIVNPTFVQTGENRVFEVRHLFNLIQQLDPSLGEIVLADPDDQRRSDLVYKEGGLLFRGIPLDKLATGYIALVKVVQEIIAGFGAWEGLLGQQDIANTPGVVFIDEIEAHLHPKWQAQILPLLKRSFPKATFYVCTHSPLVVASTEEGEAYELLRTGNDVTARKLGNPREWYLADVYEQAFHVELPLGQLSGQTGPTLIDLLEEFSIKVKDQLRTKDEKLKHEAEDLYQRIIPSLPDTDPRRRSLDSLKSLLR